VELKSSESLNGRVKHESAVADGVRQSAVQRGAEVPEGSQRRAETARQGIQGSAVTLISTVSLAPRS
jgi:hypothetical protein